MVSLKLGNTLIDRNGKNVYFIAEIGQNHQGDFQLAKKMILEAKNVGCNCVKFQKSCLDAKFTKSALQRPYNSINSWGKTYGEHKAYLEFNIQQYKELQNFCREIDIDFTASAMDEISLDQLNNLNLPFIKIGSGDANNFPLLRKAAKMECSLVISTGMQTMKTIESIVNIMEKENKTNYALLHCVSSYPTKPENSQIQIISILKKKFPNCVIGYSGHELGIDISKAAVLYGARIIERHFTLNKEQKGSDHKCSLVPLEMKTLIVDIKSLISNTNCNEYLTKEQIIDLLQNSPTVIKALSTFESLENCVRVIQDCEMDCRLKLGKSIVAKQYLQPGHIVSDTDLCIKVSEPYGISAEFFDEIIGGKLNREVKRDNPLTWDHIENSNIF